MRTRTELDEKGVHTMDTLGGPLAAATTQDIAPSLSRPVFLLRLEARPGVAPIRALRWLLKTLARRHGFRCLDAREDEPQRRGRP